MHRPESMELWESVSERIGEVTGIPFRANRIGGLGGGCINEAYQVADQVRAYFVKVNRSDALEMFEAEAEGLEEMARAEAVEVPRPVCVGRAGRHAYLVMTWLDLGGAGRDPGARLGRELAALHRHRSPRFGWHRDNTIGSTPQPNAWSHDWLEFWRDRRLGFQLDLAASRGHGARLTDRGRRLLERLDGLFSGYTPEPSLLHGDLWSGNFAVTRDGRPVIFDPAVYYGDREADLAMTELFGGFSDSFYAAYAEAWPLDPGYPVRKTLYNLYHILNHLNLFGGGYAAQAGQMIDRLISQLG